MKVVIMLLLWLVAAPAAAAEPIPLNETQRAALGIQTVRVERAGHQISASLPGTVTVPNVQLHVLTAPQGGLVTRLLIAEGENVTSGQPMIEIESPQLMALQSEYLETWPRHELARANYRRDRQLFEEGIIAERRLMESRADYQAVSAALSRVRGLLELGGMDEAALEALRERRTLSGTLTVRAPIDGVVLQQLVTTGTRVEAADPLYRVGRLDPLWVEVHVPIEKAADIRPGQRVIVVDPDVSGPVITVGSMVHGSDQGVLVRAEISEGAERLRPGQFVQVMLAAGTGERYFRVPRSAVVYRDGGSYVFADDPAGFVAVAVRILSEEASHAVVEADLMPDAAIVVSGTAAVKAAWLGGE